MTVSTPHQPARVLSGRPWLLRDRPFAHYLATEVFEPGFYAELVAQFREVLDRGLAETPTADRFSRLSGFDAYGFGLRHVEPGTPLALFCSRPWHDLLARATGVPGTGHVRATLHHHRPGSRDGGVHNDLNPGYFPPPVAGEVVLPDPAVSYHHGLDADGRRPPGVVATVRALAVLFYLDNPGWRPADGGQTALYRDPDGAPEVLVPPVDNSLVGFACTPASFHRFCSNRRTPRNSVILWLHRPWDEAVRRWGEKAIVRW